MQRYGGWEVQSVKQIDILENIFTRYKTKLQDPKTLKQGTKQIYNLEKHLKSISSHKIDTQLQRVDV